MQRTSRGRNFIRSATLKLSNRYGKWYEKEILATVGRGGYCLFELADPRETDNAPHLIGVGEVKLRPVWANFWNLRMHSLSRWASWFCELESLGLRPVEKYVLGRSVPFACNIARRLARMRIRSLSLQSTGNELTCPSWLYRNLDAYDRRPKLPLGVLEITTGEVQHYEATGRYPAWSRLRSGRNRKREDTYRWERLCLLTKDSSGRIWFDDGPTVSAN